MDKILFCKVCGIDINEALLYDHISSTEHKDIEKRFIVKCMTRCELCKKGIKNDECIEHIISDKHLTLEGKKYCKLCDMKFDPGLLDNYEYNKTRTDIGGHQEHGPIHRQKYTRLLYKSR